MQNSEQVSVIAPERNGHRIQEAETETTEIPEIFEMPPAPRIRVRMSVRKIGPAPFVFVDELADEVRPRGE